MRFLPSLSAASVVTAAALAFLAHCGAGHTLAFAPTDAGPDRTTGGGTDDGGDDGASVCSFCHVNDARVPFVLCSASPPEAGTPCAVPDEACEYGTSWSLECNLVLRCMQGIWREEFSGAPCPRLDAGSGCPATWQQANAVDAAACPATDCQYPEGYCECGAACGHGGEQPWQCTPATSDCPSPRPRLGSACTGSASCAYGWSCVCGQQQGCVDGVWQGDLDPPCP
jgi:hypothetical protein